MTTESKKILAEALALPPTERAEIIDELLSSFEFPARGEIDAAWAHEAEDRIDAYERGEMRSTPARTVFERLDRDNRGIPD